MKKLLAGLFVFSIVIAVFVNVSHIESTLPVKPVSGVESGSYALFLKGEKQQATAAGQIFSPPLETPNLLKFGLYLREDTFPSPSSNIKLQLRISEWSGDHPQDKALWVSVPQLMPKFEESHPFSWIDFDVPHLSLEPQKEYVAWIVVSDTTGTFSGRINIPSMGPRYSSPAPNANIATQDPTGSPEWQEWHAHPSSIAYAQGRAVFFRTPNPDAIIDQMPQLPWAKEDIGINLHFRMTFENRPRFRFFTKKS